MTGNGLRPRLADSTILDWTQKYGLLGLLSGRAARIEMPWRRYTSEGGSDLYEKWYYARLAGRWLKLGKLGHWKTLEADDKRNLLNSPPPQTVWEIRAFELEPTLEVASRYFSEATSAADIPLPLSDEFWRLYQEPIAEWFDLAHKCAESFVRLSQYAQKKFDGHVAERHEDSDVRSALRVLNYHASLEADFHFFGSNVIEHRRSAPSLLSILANMFLLDLEAGRRIIHCATCGQFFVSNDRRAKYCKIACRNLAQTRRYRALQKLKRGT